jgi:protein-S-isoprenylcysteine O-methyltransferase Ste14
MNEKIAAAILAARSCRRNHTVLVDHPIPAVLHFMLLGEATCFGSRPIFVWFVLFVLINTIYFKLSEEPGLAERFGEEYIRYRKNVPMWIPRFRPWVPESYRTDQ